MATTTNAGVHARTQIIDAVLVNVSAVHDKAIVEAIADCALRSTTAACRAKHPLVDFEEFLSWGAL